MKSSNSPSLLWPPIRFFSSSLPQILKRSQSAFAVSVLLWASFALSESPLAAFQTRERAFEMLKKVVHDLDGKGQISELKSVFKAQMVEQRIDDAVKTLNVLMKDPENEDALFSVTQNLYYGAKNYTVEYPDIVRLIEHPSLELTNEHRDKRMDSLYDSMIHVLVQTEHMGMAVDFAKSFSCDPNSLKANDPAMGSSGYYLCRGWAKICERYLKEERIAEVIEIAESFNDSKVRRKMMQEFVSQLNSVDDVRQREHLLNLYNEAVTDNPDKRAEAEKGEIAAAIDNGEFETAEFLLDSYDNFEDYFVARNAVALIEALYEAGRTEDSTTWLRKLCASKTSSSFVDEIGTALVRVELHDLAAEFLGPRRMTDSMTSPMFTQTHQPLLKLALAALKNNDVEQALKFADAIEEPCWRSATYFELYRKARGNFQMYRDEWYEKAIEVAQETEKRKHRDRRLYIIIRDRLPKERALIEERLALIESPTVKAETLAWWLTQVIDNKSAPQPELDRMIKQVAEWHPSALNHVVEKFVETKDTVNALSTAKLYLHTDEMSAYQFDDLFKLLFPNTSNQEVLNVIDAQTPNHRGRIMSYALRHVPADRKKEFASEILQRLDKANIDLQLTNALLKTYLDWNDFESIKKILNIDLPDDQFVYDEGEYNAWPNLAQQFAFENGGKATIEFAQKLTPPRMRAITYGCGISRLLSENPTDEGLNRILKQVEANPDAVMRGHGRLRIARRLLANIKSESAEDSKTGGK